MARLGTRFWAEAGAAGVSTLLFIATLVWRDWLEIVFRVDPDGGSGAVEWLVVALSGLVAVTCMALARVEWRRAHAAGRHAGALRR